VRPETVCQDGRADAWVLGSGIAKDDELRVSAILSHVDAPLKVVDAGALDVIDFASLEPMTAILTPHAGELARLLDRFGRHFELDYEAVVAAATMLGQVVVLKGSMTLIASPTGEVVAVGPNPASLATAGTGDVLAGIMGALLASNAHLSDLDLVEVAKLAVSIHSEAARLAERSGPVVALDVAEAVREVVKSWQ
jgi:ADP-dependent NAD(P)H-hydrate dehydratase / NAD(P)H-hydrate epimerase